jgi:hypothetical protein
MVLEGQFHDQAKVGGNQTICGVRVSFFDVTNGEGPLLLGIEQGMAADLREVVGKKVIFPPRSPTVAGGHEGPPLGDGPFEGCLGTISKVFVTILGVIGNFPRASGII